MKTNIFSVLFALMLGFSLAGFMAPAAEAEAKEGRTLHVEARDLPTIVLDGMIGVGEWGAPDFTGTQTSPDIGSFNIYVENDAHNLYVAAQYTGDDFTLAQQQGLATALNIYIDSNPPTLSDGVVDNGDLAVIASDDDMWIPYVPGENDWDRQGSGSFSGAGGEVAFDGDYTTGNGIVEVKIPFSLLDGVGPGSTIGLLFQAFGNDHCTPGYTGTDPSHPNWPETYTDLTLSTPPPPVGGTIYPGNNLALLAPWIGLGLVIVAGTIIFLRRRRAWS